MRFWLAMSFHFDPVIGRHLDAAVAFVISTPPWRGRNLVNSAWMRFLASLEMTAGVYPPLKRGRNDNRSLSRARRGARNDVPADGLLMLY